MELEFTREELEVINGYLMRKLTRLEEINLTDGYCYPKFLTFRVKMMAMQERLNEDGKVYLQTIEK